MLEIANFIALNPNAAVSFLAVLVACFLGYTLYKQWERRSAEMEKNFTSSESRFNYQTQSIERALAETRRDLNSHREDMGKASKAITGDLLKVKEHVFQMRQDIQVQVDELRKFSGEIHRSMVLAQETAKIAIENLNEKLGRVILIEQKMQTFDSYLVKLQESYGENKTDLLKQRAWFSEVAKTLQSQKARLESLEKEVKVVK